MYIKKKSVDDDGMVYHRHYKVHILGVKYVRINHRKTASTARAAAQSLFFVREEKCRRQNTVRAAAFFCTHLDYVRFQLRSGSN